MDQSFFEAFSKGWFSIRLNFSAAGLALSLFLLAAGCAQNQPPPPPETPLQPANAEEGNKIFQRRCALCHGEDAKANTPTGERLGVRDLTEENWQKVTKDEEILKILRQGKEKMPAFGRTLSAQDLSDLLAYIRGLKP